jgi:hypothetical protein
MLPISPFTFEVRAIEPYPEPGVILATADVAIRFGTWEIHTAGWRVLRTEEHGLFVAPPSHHVPGKGRRKSVGLPRQTESAIRADILRQFTAEGW